MRLADLIRNNHATIISEWETFARSLNEERQLSDVALRDHAVEILDAIVLDMESAQSARQQTAKSKGEAGPNGMDLVGKVHADLRIDAGFRLDEIISEYRALRASVLRLWAREREATEVARDDVTRFNEAVDSAVAEAASRVTHAMLQYRDQTLAVLGHDLRNPLGAITMCAQSIASSAQPDDRQGRLAARIQGSAARMTRMVGDLLDLTRTRLGVGLNFTPAPMDLEPLCRMTLAELEALHPGRDVRFETTGDLCGHWDADRLAQVISNLAGNALQHGEGKSVRVTATGSDEAVSLEFHNEGRPIAAETLKKIFEPFVRGPKDGGQEASSSMGLGLYIAREIVTAHGGTIAVSSTAAQGTSFLVRLPRGLLRDVRARTIRLAPPASRASTH